MLLIKSILCDVAIEALNANKMGIGVNYDNLISKLINSVFPNHFKLEMTEKRREHIVNISRRYSKGVGDKKGDWKEDRMKKDKLVSPKIKEACKTFLYTSYTILEKNIP